jgi:alpha-L-fucosidase
MKLNSEAIYATQKSPLPALPWGRCTTKDENAHTILYLSVFDWPANGKISVPGLNNKRVVSCVLLAHDKKLKTQMTGEDLTIQVPEKAPDTIATVIKLEVQGTL